MSELPNKYPKTAWICGREHAEGSLAFGEVVVPQVNLWKHAGSLPQSGKVIGKLTNGTCVAVLNEVVEKDSQTYYEISSELLRGWVSGKFLSWSWSCFTFLGKFSPVDACRELDLNLNYAGMELLIKQHGFAIVVEGDPGHFDAIRFAVSKFIDRISNAQTPLTVVPLRHEFSNWVEVPIREENGRRIVGFLPEQMDSVIPITIDQMEIAHTIVPLMASVPYLDLALSDFFQAINYPQHALIFLARSIESIECYFGDLAKESKGSRKKEIMRDLLGIKKADMAYVTRRANESHRRHASPDATVKDLHQDELDECFKKTSEIIVAFVTFLENSGL